VRARRVNGVPVDQSATSPPSGTFASQLAEAGISVRRRRTGCQPSQMRADDVVYAFAQTIMSGSMQPCVTVEEQTMFVRLRLARRWRWRAVRAAKCAEMTRHRIAIGILQPLEYAGVRQQQRPNVKFDFSVLLESDLSGNFPLLASTSVTTAQPISHHATDAISKTSNVLQIPHP
jgi:hypothetical protein